jgi:hypothetical protein
MVTKLVPQTLRYPQRSADFFELAVFLFEGNYMQQGIDSVLECFEAWSPLIEQHEHSEVR